MATNADLDAALQSDTVPDNIISLWLGIKSIKLDTASFKDDIDALDIRTKALEEVNLARDDEFRTLQTAVEVLQAKMVRGEMLQKQLANRLRT